jgi:hypothetical protein
MHALRTLSLALVLGCAACGGQAILVNNNTDGGTTGDAAPPGVDGSSDGGQPDSGVDSPEPPPGVFCNGAVCASGQYCIHPGFVGCSSCSPMNGPCTPPSYPSNNPGACGPVPAPGDAGLWCVTPPPMQQPPYCSATIPQDCVSPMVQGPDVTCASLACGG